MTIIMFFINLFMIITMVIVMYYQGSISAKPNGNVILGTTLPHEKINCNEVLDIVNKYKKANKIYTLITAITYIPCFFLERRISLWLYYMLAWCFIIIYAQGLVYKKYFNKLQKLKQENHWYLVKKNIISIDTKLQIENNKITVSKFWFIPSIAVYIIAFILKVDIILILSMFSCTLLCMALYYIYNKRRGVVYTSNSEKNIICNNIYRRIWSIIWVASSFIMSLTTLIYKLSEELFLIYIFLSSTALIIGIIYGYNKIIDTQNALLINESDEALIDDDIYYGPFFYNNPNDSRILVDKRVGIGQTLNIGNKKGKAIWIGSIIFLIACLLPTLIITAKLDNPNFYLEVNNNTVTIEAPMYGIEFNTSEIEDVKLVQYKDIKGARKTNGAATSEIALGNFTFNDYGKTKTYVYKKVEDIIVIKLKDKYVFINGNTNEKTEEYYNKLIKYTE